MKKLLLSLAATTLSAMAMAQDFPYGKFSEQELDMKTYAKDTAAHAVYLKEYGKSWISSAERQPLIHEYHAKIKIFDSKAYKYGNIEIPLYKTDNDNFERVSDIQAIVTYRDANGSIKTAELDPKKVIHENQNKYWDVVKFAIPDLHPGCIIEYKYQLESHRSYAFKDWQFQAPIPKIYSEYEARIPAIYTFNVSLRGPLKLSKNTADLDKECFTPGGGIKADCSKIIYAINDIPAFIEEDYMTSPKNFMSAIYFELADYYNYQTGTKQKVAQEWKDIDFTLKKSEYFGGQIKRKGLMEDRIKDVIAGKITEMDKAKAIYQFVQKNFKWNGFTSYGSSDGIRSALNSHTGTVGDINLTLVAALNAAGINTEAVLLSTREHGAVNKLYPVESEFNYVIAKANIGDQSYLLDGTDPLLGFGMLPLRCINDQGRVMSMNKPSYWMDMVAPKQKSSTSTLDLTLMDNGKIKGTIVNYSLGYEGYEKRKEIKKFNSFDEFVENKDEKMPKLKILKWEISNLDSLDQPLGEKYEVELDAFDNLNSNRLAFNPFILERVISNPFKLAERTYPVDMGMPSSSRFILNMKLPAQYEIEKEPATVGVAMPDKGGKFVTSYAANEGGFVFSHITEFSRPVYNPTEYPYLKEMFNKIIQSEKADLVFKKK